MDIRKIKKLIELTHKFNISELEVSEKEQTIRISRIRIHPSHVPIPQVNIPDTQQYTVNSKDISQQIIKNSTTATNVEKTITTEHLIRSPMVGIFYITPDPNAKPFIEIGQKVNVGDTICIIEAMKMMNRIKSDKSGVIKDILLNNGQPVEFDEPIVVIEE